MPLLDVTEVLSDPLFQTSFDVIRSTHDRDQDGFTVESEAPVAGVLGVIQPAKELSMQRLPEGTLIESTITIWTTYPLTSGVEGQGADVVIYQNAAYVVADVSDWSAYGKGYVQAIATMKDFRPYQ